MAETRFEIRKSKDAQFYFVQLAKNGQVLTTSETYKRLRAAADGAIAAGAEAPVDYVGKVDD